MRLESRRVAEVEPLASEKSASDRKFFWPCQKKFQRAADDFARRDATLTSVATQAAARSLSLLPDGEAYKKSASICIVLHIVRRGRDALEPVNHGHAKTAHHHAS
jgi:hypothetical protein